MCALPQAPASRAEPVGDWRCGRSGVPGALPVREAPLGGRWTPPRKAGAGGLGVVRGFASAACDGIGAPAATSPFSLFTQGNESPQTQAKDRTNLVHRRGCRRRRVAAAAQRDARPVPTCGRRRETTTLSLAAW